VDPGELAETCGSDPSFVCRELLERTDSAVLAGVADWAFAKPVTIVIILFAAWLVVRIVDRIIDRFVQSIATGSPPTRTLKRGLRRTPIVQALPDGTFESGPPAVRAARRAQTLGHVLHSIVAVTVWSIAALSVLGELGINLGPLIAAAGIAGVALGFGAQSLVKDFLAGIFLLVEDQYGVGDIIDVGEVSGSLVTGVVESVSLRSTRIRSTNGTVWHIPNGTVLRVGNMSQQWARALLDVSVGYDADLVQAQAVIKRTADEVWRDPDWSEMVLEEPELWGIEDLAADGVTIRLVVKTQPAEQFRVMRELRARIKLALDQAGVEIPFPQRTVWVRTDPGAAAITDGDSSPD
jgi:small conductance mechanosensitive channel